MLTQYQQIWQEVLTLNDKIFETRRIAGSLGILLTSEVRNRLKVYVWFASIASHIKSYFGYIPLEWRAMCYAHESSTYLYSPRWTLSMFYIRGKLTRYLYGKNGLDIGAITGCPPLQNVLLATGLFETDIRLTDMELPHFQYYAELGANMTAIDIKAPNDNCENVKYGDIRLLEFRDQAFDFITVPMILGPGNPCDTYLELALSISEMWRITSPGGFVYIADCSFSPVVAFAAQIAGFIVYCSKGSKYGLPVGTFLRRPSDSQVISIFDDIFYSTRLVKIDLQRSGNMWVDSCNLLLDHGFPSCDIITE
ncbi:MAG: hypothetical protein IIA61_01785 [Candidatus Marinimicrobia bacterium]|nr:hypothetical protein [Candidatus Neomarinimicrobiota bacterium]